MLVPAWIDRDLLRRRRWAVVVGAIVFLLAVVETANAVLAPTRAPSEQDWSAAAAKVRAGFQPGDLIVAAPAWADPLMRLQLGDLVPVPVAGRMDAGRYGRIWEVAQRGARSPETAGARVAERARFGKLTVTRWEKRAAAVTFDFVAQWRQATMSVARPDGVEIPCTLGPERFACMNATLGAEVLEIDTSLRHALSLQPVEGVALVLEYPAVALGRELAVAAGLHNVWLRKAGAGIVRLRVTVDGRELGALPASSTSGWTVQRFDTAPLAGQVARVRFEITVDKAHGRHLGFAAEARIP